MTGVLGTGVVVNGGGSTDPTCAPDSFKSRSQPEAIKGRTRLHNCSRSLGE